MRSLRDVRATPEQHKLIVNTRPGVRIIRGAAGSGKTTTALLMLRMALGFLVSEKKRTGRVAPIQAAVFTFNRTLAAYVQEMAKEAIKIQKASPGDINLEVTTLAKYALRHLPPRQVLPPKMRDELVKQGTIPAGLDPDFVAGEVDYLLSRFPPNQLSDYVDAERTGRGAKPRVEKKVRREILEQVVSPYSEKKMKLGVLDWNDVILDFTKSPRVPLDIVVVDEAQDFSANQLRAITSQLTDQAFATFVLDTAQRIYRNGFTWREVGLEVRPEDTYRLERNYRNTTEIARFASQLLDENRLDEDATLPLFSTTALGNYLPVVAEGRFMDQVGHAIEFITTKADLATETVAFLHPKGGGWFSYLENALKNRGLPYATTTRVGEWPEGDEQIALSTIHSAKGLEFDHVFMLGLSDECFTYEDDEDDDNYSQTKRLVAMAITRAKKSVMLGYKSENKPSFIDLFDSATYKFRKL